MPSDPSMPPVLGQEAAAKLSWTDAVDALRQGHLLPRAEIKDIVLGPATGALLSRSAYVAGLGYGTKTVTVTDANAARGLPTVQGAMLVFDDAAGTLRGIIDSRAVTNLKTAADSVLGAQLLARANSQHLLIVGAGSVAANLARAYAAMFPGLDRISIWARRPEQAGRLAAALDDLSVKVVAVPDLQPAIAEADIISSATMAREPVILGAWVRPGTHVDLIGAYKADMREADDELIGTGSLFVDSRDTTVTHIGELMIPIRSGVITAQSVKGDLYDLVQPHAHRRVAEDEVTIFKNGGGAHLDLMIAARLASLA